MRPGVLSTTRSCSRSPPILATPRPRSRIRPRPRTGVSLPKRVPPPASATVCCALPWAWSRWTISRLICCAGCNQRGLLKTKTPAKCWRFCLWRLALSGRVLLAVREVSCDMFLVAFLRELHLALTFGVGRLLFVRGLVVTMRAAHAFAIVRGLAVCGIERKAAGAAEFVVALLQAVADRNA